MKPLLTNLVIYATSILQVLYTVSCLMCWNYDLRIALLGTAMIAWQTISLGVASMRIRNIERRFYHLVEVKSFLIFVFLLMIAFIFYCLVGGISGIFLCKIYNTTNDVTTLFYLSLSQIILSIAAFFPLCYVFGILNRRISRTLGFYAQWSNESIVSSHYNTVNRD